MKNNLNIIMMHGICGLLLVLIPSCANTMIPSRPIYLRSKPAIVSRRELIIMIRKYGFDHPADLAYAGLSESMAGDFRHHYAVELINDATVVFDHATGLMWQQFGSEEPVTWMQAKEYVKQLNQEQFAGYNTWRLPTIEELASLLEFRKRPEQLYLDPRFDTLQWICWSADMLNPPVDIWFIHFDHGYVSNTDANSELYVRAVRTQ